MLWLQLKTECQIAMVNGIVILDSVGFHMCLKLSNMRKKKSVLIRDQDQSQVLQQLLAKMSSTIADIM